MSAYTPGKDALTLSDIRHGTGWPRDVRFLEVTPLIAAASEMYEKLAALLAHAEKVLGKRIVNEWTSATDARVLLDRIDGKAV